MLIYKQRYKPRTTREFTKSDLTVYDSAGNTALNALTVYGKSEVVDGTIKSAGEGYAVVDLGTLTWNIYNGVFFSDITDMIAGTTYNAKRAMFCKKYTKPTITPPSWTELPNKNMLKNDAQGLFIKDTDYETPAQFKTAMSGVLLCYKLADPTQGNAIAIKTDNGTGINGTMATFSTGTPLRGITGGARDVMVWDGSAGTVTKNTRKIIIDNNSDIFLWDAGGAGGFFISQQQIAPPYDDNTPFNGLSNVPILARNAVINSQIVAIASNAAGSNVLFKIPSAVTVNDAKTYLQNNPITLIYKLAAPTTEQLTATENASIAGLRTFTPQTHAQNNAQTDMTVDYTIRVPTI